MRINTFDQLIVWQEAHKLTLLIYKITGTFPSSEKFNLTSQLRRAAVSVESCIAEGFHRFHYKDRLVFYFDARGSIGEIQSQLYDARDLHFLINNQFTEVFDQSKKTAIVLGGLIKKTQERSSQK